MADSPTIVVARLDDQELQKSIKSMVDTFNESLNGMKTHADSVVEAINASLKGIKGGSASSGGSSEDGSTKRAKAQTEEAKAVKESATSYDQLLSALQMAQREVKKWESHKVFTTQDIDQYQAALARVVELHEKLRQVQGSETYKKFDDLSKRTAFDAKATIRDITAVDDRLKQLNRYYADLEKQSQKTSASVNKQLEEEAGKRSMVIEQMRAFYKEQERLSKESAKIQNKEFREAFSGALSMPVSSVDEARAKIERLKALLDEMKSKRGEGIVNISEADINRVSNAITKLNQQIDKDAQKRIANLEKEKSAQDKVNQSYQDAALKAEFTKVMRMPTDNLDAVQNKLERLKTLLANLRDMGILTPQQIGGAEAEIAKLTNKLNEQVRAQQSLVKEAQQYTEEIRKQAQEIRESKQWKETGHALIGNRVFYDPDQVKGAASLEEQLLAAKKEEEALLAAKSREVAISQEAAQAQQQVTNAVSGTAIAYGDVHKMAEQALGIKHNADGSKQKQTSEVQYLREQLASLLEVEQREVTLTNTKQASYNELSAELKQLTAAYHRLGADIAKTEGADIVRRIQTIQREMQKLQQTMSRPVSWEAVDSLPTNTLDDIAYKLRQMQLYKSGLDLKEQASEIGIVNNAYDSLRRAQLKYMSDAQKLTGINAALGRSWNYMKNRLAYYFTVTTSVSLVKQVAEIRGQYELMERSIGILVNDMSRGTDIFNKLNDMALKSPFTMLELGSAAKQLVAFNIAADDVVDTTRRLADMAAAVGLPIERLTYALGQVKAYGYLNSRDARIFLNAGIPIVQMLTDMYNRQRDVDDELVTASQVRDMMTKRMISYADVMKVVNEATDAGGRFFNFQERAAETLKVKIANLSLAWNNMLNDVGASNQGFMSGGLRVVTSMLKHWREFSRVLSSLIVTIGVYKTVASMVAVQNDRMVTTGMLASLQNWVGGIKKASGAMATLNAVMGHNPVLFGATLMTALTSYFLFFRDTVGDAGRKVKELNDSIDGVSKQMAELYVKAMSTDSLNSQIEDLRQMLNRIQSDFGITIPVNLEDVDEGNIKNKIQEVRRRIDSYLAFTQTFGTVAIENERLGDSFDKFGAAATATFNDITNNLAVIQKGMLMLGATADEVALLDRQEGESTVEYLSRIISLYEQLQILRKSELENVYKTPMAGGLPVLSQDNMYDLEKMQSSALDALGVKNKAVFQNMLKDVQDYYSTLSLSKSAFDKFARELEKELDINNILDVDERTLKIEAAIEKYAAQKSLAQSATELLKYLANQRYHTNIKVGIDPNAKKDVEQELKDWQIELQREADKQGIKLKVTFTEAQTEAGYAAEALKQVKDAEEELAVLSRKKSVGTATQEDIDEATKKLENLRKAAKLAGADLASLNKSKGGSKKDPVLDALKTEIKLVEQLQGEYDKLTKSSASREEALGTIRGAFGNTIKQLNSQLRGYGLPELTTQLITGKDPNKALAHFKQTLQSLVDRGMMSLERSKEVEAIIEKLTISAKTYNLDKITKGLNSELDKLKEEYELAVELDANPELGSLFADWWDIDMEGLPRTAQAYAERATKLVNQYLKNEGADMELPLLTKITNDDLRSLREAVDSDQFNAKWLEVIENAVKASRDVRQKEASDQITDWNNLLQKYSEYEYKKEQIMKNAEKERQTLVEKFGNSQQKETYATIKTQLDAEEDPEKKDALRSQLIEIIDSITSGNDTALQIKTSIDTQKARDLANLDFTEFQKTGTWAVATGDLAGMTNTALRGLIRSLEEYKAKAKNLDPKQIKQINRALKSLHSELRKNNPFGAIADAMEEARLRSNELDVDIQQTEAQIDRLIEKREKNGKLTEKEEQELADYRKQLNGLNKEQGALADVSLQTMVTEVTKVTSALSGATSMVGELAEAFGDTATAEVVKDVGTVLDKIGQGASIGSIGGGWGALAGAIVGLGAGLAQIFAGSGNKKITEAVEDSEDAVNRLEAQYKSLEYAVEKSYGVAQIGALKASKANKELQLAEMKRQLQLEESREAKHRDEEKIESLKGQIIDLEHEINDMVEDFVNDVMGISSVGDAMENVVSAMIEAFKKGEDYMKEYDDSFAQMIDNMIAKSIASQLISETIEKVAKKVKDAAYTRTNRKGNERRQQELLELIPKYQSELDDWEGDVAQRFEEYQDRLDEYNQHRGRMDWEEVQHAYDHYIAGQNDVDRRKAEIAALQKELDSLNKLLGKEVVMTPEDVNAVRNIAAKARNDVQENFKALMDAYGITFGQDAENQGLSQLQQGIQSVSEQTASAIEGYMNGVSQQVYLHSTLLTQIRDVMVTFDPEVSMGIQSQMLLQLQTQYQLMESMHSLMSSWTNPAGNGIRVELLS